jgi:hypothetical protein
MRAGLITLGLAACWSAHGGNTAYSTAYACRFKNPLYHGEVKISLKPEFSLFLSIPGHDKTYQCSLTLVRVSERGHGPIRTYDFIADRGQPCEPAIEENLRRDLRTTVKLIIPASETKAHSALTLSRALDPFDCIPTLNDTNLVTKVVRQNESLFRQTAPP